jgi:hypothetical protein
MGRNGDRTAARTAILTTRTVELIVRRWKETRARVEPYLTPSERQRQLKREDDHRALRRAHEFGQWRLLVLMGSVMLFGTGGIPNALAGKPLFVLFALGIIAFGFYKRYFPSEPPPHELPPEQPPAPARPEPMRDEAAAAQAAAERRKKRLMMTGW